MASKRSVDKKWIAMLVLGAVVALQLLMWATTPPPASGVVRGDGEDRRCPGDCSQRGLCWHGHCYCPEGWNGRKCDRVVAAINHESEAEIVSALGGEDFGLYYVRSIQARSTMGAEAYSREMHAGTSTEGKHKEENNLWRVHDGEKGHGVASLEADTDQLYVNVALHSESTAQSSTYLKATSNLAVDGILDGDYHKGSVAHTEFEENPWWEIDLEREVDIHYIVLWNRDDCCNERMSDYTIFVSSQPFSSDSPEGLHERADVWHTHVPMGASFPNPSEVFPVHYRGRYVRMYVFGEETAINMAEFQVFTTPRSRRDGEKRGIPHSKMGLFLDAKRKVKARYPYNDFQFEKVYTDPEYRTGYPLTIGAVPKAFSRKDNPLVYAAQANAILSWRALVPRPRIVLFGDDEGVAEFAERYGLDHVPDMDTTKWGGPTLDFILEETAARSDKYFMFINADITLTAEFARAFRVVADKFASKDWLLVGQRRNIPQDTNKPYMIDFDSNHWEEDTRALAKKVGLFNVWGEDYFLMTKTMFEESEVLPFAVGRCAYDNWLVNTVLKKKVPVVDGSEVVLAVHFNHDYRHIKAGKDPWDTPECKYNKKLMKKKTDWYKGSTDHAQYKLEPCDSGDMCVKKRK